jgi:hypothetical protein
MSHLCSNGQRQHELKMDLRLWVGGLFRNSRVRWIYSSDWIRVILNVRGRAPSLLPSLRWNTASTLRVL